MVNEGELAPDFEALDTGLKAKKLSDYKGHVTVLAFFPGAFTSVCTKEMCTFRDSMANFNKFNAKVVGISVDSPFSLKEFATKNNLQWYSTRPSVPLCPFQYIHSCPVAL